MFLLQSILGVVSLYTLRALSQQIDLLTLHNYYTYLDKTFFVIMKSIFPG
jgi:hypothetical protein